MLLNSQYFVSHLLDLMPACKGVLIDRMIFLMESCGKPLFD